MTDTQTTSDEPITDAAGETAAVGELLWVDPRILIVGVNVRDEANLDRYFVRDIGDRGVREPITVRRSDGGALVVRKGKRRTLAAIEAGLERVRVFIEPEPDPNVEDIAAQIERIVDQLGENAHRSRNSDADEVRAHQELLDLGLSAGQIARRTHTPTKRVRVTTAVARSELASAVLARYDLTLDQVAVIAEFDDRTGEGVEAVKLLTVSAQRDPGQFAHLAQRLRDRGEDQQRRAARVAELTEAGIRIINSDNPSEHGTGPDDADPEGGSTSTAGATMLSNLRPTADGQNGTALSEDDHASCPGHAASVGVERGWRGGAMVTTTWWCTDPDAYGHAPRWDRPTSSGSETRQPGPMSEQDKAERRRVITNNQDWDSATTVRKQWLTALLARKSAPKDAGRYIAATLARGSHDVRKAMESSHPTACALLGLEAPASYYSGKLNPISVALETAPSPRLAVITLAVLLGAAEDGTSRNSWRSPSSDTRSYFAALAAWGYELSPVEQLVSNPDADCAAATEEVTADEVDTDHDNAPTGEDDPGDDTAEHDAPDQDRTAETGREETGDQDTEGEEISEQASDAA